MIWNFIVLKDLLEAEMMVRLEMMLRML